MTFNSNIFYVASEKTVYICWEKVNVEHYRILRDGIIIASSENEETEFVRPYEFDNDHHTELFKSVLRNWLYFKDNTVQDLRKYQYQIQGIGGTTSEEYNSLITEVYTS